MDENAVAPTCRICRSEAEAGAPLFHPCKCTGSIRFCHQDCLIEWLQHSQKKHCELCGYEFVFRKHYKQSMPGGRLSSVLYVRFALWRLLSLALAIIRVVVAAAGWLVVVPRITHVVWRYYFYIADASAALVLHEPVPEMREIPELRIFSREWLVDLFWPSSDTWPYAVGITAGIAIAFICVFLLREWIVIHMQHLLRDEDLGQERERLRVAANAMAQARALREANEIPEPVAPAAQTEEGGAPEQASDTDQAPIERDQRAGNDDGWVTDEDGDWVDEAAVENMAHQDDLLRNIELFDDGPLDEQGDWDNPEMEQFEDDWAGVFDALGLRGPFLVLLQNLLILQLLCIVISAIFIVLPYFVGRVVGFKAYNLFLLPVDMLRAVTDPVFDALFGLLAYEPVPPAPRGVSLVDRMLESAGGHPVLATAAKHAVDAFRVFSRGFASLQSLTQGRNVFERALCVALGHAYVILLTLIESRFSVFGTGGKGGIAQRVLRENLLILKVLFFSVLDLIIFPLVCGTLLDWCLLPLFPAASLSRRLGEAIATPLSFLFLRWISGTVYMFHTSQFISAIRNILRPGVMHWIRDPTDQDFHPIRDILTHSSTKQLLQISESFVIYSFSLVSLFGIHLRVLQWAFPSLFPLRWMPYAPLVSVPVDILFVHFFLRLVIKRTRFTKRATRLLRRWLIIAAKLLRLSSFLLADEQPDEQGTFTFASWGDRLQALVTALRRKPLQIPPAEPTRFSRDGGFARVPADDKPARNVSYFIRTDAAGVPVDDEARDQLAQQLRAIARLSTRPRYTIVYTPPRFVARVYAFVGAVWLFFAASVASLTIPLACGRALLARVGAEVHDMYAFSAGIAALLVAAYTLALVAPLCGRGFYFRLRQLLARISPAAVYLCRFAYLIGTFGMLVPFLTGIVLHQYILVLVQYSVEEVPTVNALYAWALGLLSLHTVYFGLLTFVPDNVPPVMWDMYDSFQDDGVRNAPLAAATRFIIAPVTGVLFAALLLPHACAWLYLANKSQLADASVAQQQTALRVGNALVFAGALVYVMWLYSNANIGAWTRELRDELFLQSTELCNFESDIMADSEKDEGTHAARGSLPDRFIRA
ncbi:RING-type E3 ubiquitin transferase [Malassezia cuniculi]|uniref:RING-type E3 ubiquitin transferase n=1 Tax=Malassezia cuniculi TaxID=948313 RepID=A0AAF0ENF4_9BASI|nr:RING-type E3 ubiquitin transferase [Malassezia cuniculi]